MSWQYIEKMCRRRRKIELHSNDNGFFVCICDTYFGTAKTMRGAFLMAVRGIKQRGNRANVF